MSRAECVCSTANRELQELHQAKAGVEVLDDCVALTGRVFKALAIHDLYVSTRVFD
jgi:hypothetical protein